MTNTATKTETEHDEAQCLDTCCLPPGVERERVLLQQWRDHEDEMDAEAGVRS